VEQVFLAEAKRYKFDNPDNIDDVIVCFKRLFEMKTFSGNEWNEVESAFSQAPQGHQVYPKVYTYEEIVKLYCNYTSARYVAPYTSVMGPSGIGKSYSVQQIA
jgi:hypothetical protein